ncbi:hypothetical protein FB45DRAFT_1060853 [Roridomyces roridus]|uniref:Six-hairpin glycosidase n=1 Tax=Roridomyces roridus TaxID=1738132 RepID=A0AAD7FK10_9AGAR|nr:hypothetical protein FB45DRAFT_1060853 [Roridomyces roridus]
MYTTKHTFISCLFAALTATASPAAASSTPFDPGFDISSVIALAQQLPSHSWEYGTAAEMLLELQSTNISVYGSNPFPVPTLDPSTVPAMAYAEPRTPIGAHGLANGNGAVGDPASLGTTAVLLGKTNATFAQAAADEIEYVVGPEVPRWVNGAISHRADIAELWADFIYMAPPFIAYYASDTNNASLLETAYIQCGLYREVLLFNSSASTFSPLGTSPTNGLWHHIIGPQSQDLGLWSTSNGWAAGGMARVLQTIIKAPVALGTSWRSSAISDLTGWIKEIIDGARASPMQGGLLLNYLDDTSGDGHGFPEISGSSMLAAVAYRMMVTAPDAFPAPTYLPWADGIRTTLGGVDADGNPHITVNGTATPAVNPLSWQSTVPWTAGSPEGNCFVVLMYNAWRDCVYAGICNT